LDLSLLRRSSL